MENLNKVKFTSGKSELLQSAFFQLDSLVTVLKTNEKLKLEIAGYTDNTGDATINKNLSEKRAKAVYDYMVNKGIEAKRMSFAGYGSDNPVASNTTPEGQQANRRIEVKVISSK